MICFIIPLFFSCVYLNRHSLKIISEQQKNSELNSVTLQSQNISNDFNRLVKLSSKIGEDNLIFDNEIDLQTKNKVILDIQEENADIVSEIYIFSKNGKFLRTHNSLVINPRELFDSVYNTAMESENGVKFLSFSDRVNKEHLCLVKGLTTDIDKMNSLIIMLINPNSYKVSRSIAEVRVAIDRQTINNVSNSDTNIDDINLEEFTKEDRSFQDFEEDGEKYILTTASDMILNTEHVLTVYSVLPSKSLSNKIKIGFTSKIIYFVLPFLFSVAIIGVFAINFSRRLNAFKNHMHNAASGDFTVSTSQKGMDEISELYDDLNLMISSIEHLITTVYESQVQKEKLNSRQKEVEFKMLASQINPHFLYNTLETIRMKARSNGQKDIEELVKMLAKIMRRNIQAGDTLVTLKSEVDLVEYYLKIQQYRFGERIRFHINLFCDIEYLKIMPLIIQPIVENAFVHGLETKEGEGEIRIEVRRSNNRLQIYVLDDGIGMTKEKLSEIKLSLTDFSRLTRSNIGLSNVDQRIKLLYGEDYGLWIDSAENTGTTVIIDLPEDMSQ
jgi:two-component system sensor histidine kinase YesM